jgi:hypothetical protein
MGRSYDTISIVTIQEMVEEGRRLDVPMSLEVVKSAKPSLENNQLDLLG